VGDEERTAKLGQLLQRLSEVTARKAALLSEARELAHSIGEARKALGNPFFYSGATHGRPENADKTVAKYTGNKSQQPTLRLFGHLAEVQREVRTLREQLHELGHEVQ